MNRSRLLRSLATLSVLLVPTVVGSSATRPSTQPVSQHSGWGPETRGVRCRVEAPLAIEQGMPLTLGFEFHADPASFARPRDPPERVHATGVLPAHAGPRDERRRTRSARLHPTRHAGAGHRPGCRRSTGNPRGRGRRNSPCAARAKLKPGDYDCTASYVFPGPKWFNGPDEKKAAMDRHRRQRRFRLKVLPEVPRTITAWLPVRPRWPMGPRSATRRTTPGR